MLTRDARSRIAALLSLTTLLLAGAGCGAKTGLRIWDRDVEADGFDAADVPDARDVPDVPDVCVPGMFTLERRGAEVMFVIDRSSSMAQTLDGQPLDQGGMDPRSRWRIVRNAFNTALPPFESSLWMGAQFYPVPGGPGASLEVACRAVSGGPPDVAPRANAASDIVAVFDRTLPSGGTPTFDALRAASDYLASSPSRGRARYIVLATDGGPNCNGVLDPSTCVCTSRDQATGLPNCASSMFAFNCLDIERTLRVLSQTFELRGIPTFVVGIPDRTRPDLSMALDQMAVAGGRPRMTEPRFYSVSSPESLLDAFRTVQNSIARCAYVTPSRPDDPDGITVLLDGAPLARDAGRTNGWDWTDAAFGEITLFGPACDRAIANPNIVVTARVGCRDAGRGMP